MTPATPDSQPAWLRFVGPLCVPLVAVVLLYWTRFTWPDVLIDSGREAYIPWRIAQGQVLYRDLGYFSGPLSPHINALAMKLLGFSLRTLFIINSLIIVAVTALIYTGIRRVAGRLTAALGAAAYLCLFCFGQLSFQDSCSFMYPYSHEMTHGALLLFILAALFARYQHRPGPGLLMAAGFCFGLLFLTKPELFLGGAAMLVTAYGLTWWRECRLGNAPESTGPSQRLPAHLALLLIPAVIPIVVAWTLLSAAMPAAAATRGVLGSWVYMGDPRLTGMLYFKLWMGTLDPLDSAVRLMKALGFWTLFLAPPFLVARFASHRLAPMRAAFVGAVYCIVVIGILGYLLDQVPWLELVRPLPILLLALASGWSISLRRNWSDPTKARTAIFMLAMTLFSAALLLKLGAYARVWHYGFVLGLPGVLLAIVTVTDHIPTWLGRKGCNPLLFRAPAVAILLMFIAGHLAIMHRVISAKQYAVGDDGNLIYADSRGVAVGDLINGMQEHLPPNATVAVLPEGVMLNVLTHRLNPTAYSFALPSDMTMFGEDRMLESYAQHPPDFIILAHRYTAEYGFPFFGRDYGQKLFRWVAAHYAPVGQVGETPLVDKDHFGFIILRRVDPPR